MLIRKEFRFEAAHWLPHVGPDHPCGRVHGHSYRVTIELSGPVTEFGWVRDFAEIKDAWRPLREQLDHHTLNDIDGLTNPTSEMLAIWIYYELEPKLPQLVAVEVSETRSTRAIYRGMKGE